MSDEAFKRYSDAFEKFLVPDENDEPVLIRADLVDALVEAGISGDSAPSLLPQMDPENSGAISFENFVSVCMKNDAQEIGDSSNAESSSGGFEDDSDEDYEDEVPENPTMERMFAMFSQGSDQISVESLEKAGRTISVNVPRSDLEKMVKMCSDKASFARMWRQLN